MNTVASGEILSIEVMEVIADVLELGVSEVHMDASLVDDLDADSLDLVDISFSLGKKFGFKLPTTATLIVAQEMQPEPDTFVLDGKLTEMGVALLQGSPNRYSKHDVNVGMSVDQVLSNTHVKHWCNLCNCIAQQEGVDGDTAVKTYVSEFLKTHKLAA